MSDLFYMPKPKSEKIDWDAFDSLIKSIKEVEELIGGQVKKITTIKETIELVKLYQPTSNIEDEELEANDAYIYRLNDHIQKLEDLLFHMREQKGCAELLALMAMAQKCGVISLSVPNSPAAIQLLKDEIVCSSTHSELNN